MCAKTNTVEDHIRDGISDVDISDGGISEAVSCAKLDASNGDVSDGGISEAVSCAKLVASNSCISEDGYTDGAVGGLPDAAEVSMQMNFVFMNKKKM